MMPDLGRYALEVSLAYGVSLALLLGIIVLSVARARSVARRLNETETRTGADHGA